jgi:transposase
VREAYHINAVILLGKGRTAADVANALLIDPETVRTYFKRFKRGGIDDLLRMNYIGSEALLDEVQLAELDAHLKEHLLLTAKPVARWVKQRWGCATPRAGWLRSCAISATFTRIPNWSLVRPMPPPGGISRRLRKSQVKQR